MAISTRGAFAAAMMLALGCTATALAQDKVDVFPKRTVDAARDKVQIDIVNFNQSAIFCELLQARAVLRAPQTPSEILETFVARSVWLPSNYRRTIQVGRARLLDLRAQLFPSIKVDVVNNDFLTTDSRCSYRQPEDIGTVYPEIGLRRMVSLPGEVYERLEERRIHFVAAAPGTYRVKVHGARLEAQLLSVKSQDSTIQWLPLHNAATTSSNELRFSIRLSKGEHVLRVTSKIPQSVDVTVDEPLEQQALRIGYEDRFIASPDNAANGTKIYFEGRAPLATQSWYHVNGRLENANGKCLAVKGDELHMDGGQVFVWDCNGTPSQRWDYEDGRFVNGGGLCLDVPAGVTPNGLQVWSCNGNPWQSLDKEFIKTP